jgi:hypothetical protein
MCQRRSVWRAVSSRRHAAVIELLHMSGMTTQKGVARQAMRGRHKA